MSHQRQNFNDEAKKAIQEQTDLKKLRLPDDLWRGLTVDMIISQKQLAIGKNTSPNLDSISEVAKFAKIMEEAISRMSINQLTK